MLTCIGFLEGHAFAHNGVLVEQSDDIVEGRLVNHCQNLTSESVHILRTILENPEKGKNMFTVRTINPLCPT